VIYDFKKPDSIEHRVIVINAYGVCSVTGDFGKWIFEKEFHLSGNCTKINDGYILQNSPRTQELYEWDGELVRKEIEETIQQSYDIESDEMSDEENEYWSGLINATYDCEYTYIAKCMNRPSCIESENIPKSRQKLNPYLLAIFDAFEEICGRTKDE
jgi:hypothetical protein